MRTAVIYYKDHRVGLLRETDSGYEFCYDAEYLKLPSSQPISLTLPITDKVRKGEKYFSKVLFPFFDGLIPEGWLLEIARKNWKINPRDRMGLLMTCCGDCIGAVSVKPLSDGNE